MSSGEMICNGYECDNGILYNWIRNLKVAFSGGLTQKNKIEYLVNFCEGIKTLFMVSPLSWNKILLHQKLKFKIGYNITWKS